MRLFLWGTITLAVIAVVGGVAIYAAQQQGFFDPAAPGNGTGNGTGNNGLPSHQNIANFEECVEAGFPVMESYPRQCATPDGQNFVEDVGNELEKQDLIRVENPRPNQTISSPLVIRGEARGTWFFEASFPVRLFDEEGNEIALEPPYIMATEEWMTEDFVPFEATLEFEAPEPGVGTLIFQKDNPSGLPENDDQLIMPVRFDASQNAQNGNDTAQNGCVATGCSGHVCAQEEVTTTCEFQPEYACYREATCERQANGECGWTQTAELTACLQNPPSSS